MYINDQFQYQKISLISTKRVLSVLYQFIWIDDETYGLKKIITHGL